MPRQSMLRVTTHAIPTKIHVMMFPRSIWTNGGACACIQWTLVLDGYNFAALTFWTG